MSATVLPDLLFPRQPTGRIHLTLDSPGIRLWLKSAPLVTPAHRAPVTDPHPDLGLGAGQ